MYWGTHFSPHSGYRWKALNLSTFSSQTQTRPEEEGEGTA